MAGAGGATRTPVNTISRENLTVLIRNNVFNDSVEFLSDCDAMETDSPVRRIQNLQPVSKKLFRSPMNDHSSNREAFVKNTTASPRMGECVRSGSGRNRKAIKRKQFLVADTGDTIKRAYVTECEGDSYSPELCGGMRKKMLVSLFHNKEYSIDFS